MSFSCEIKAGDKDLTNVETGSISGGLFGLGPSGSSEDLAPYFVCDFRDVVARCVYGDRLKDAAQDCFIEIQRMAKANLESISSSAHCETCSCPKIERKPDGWSAKALRALLAIDPNEITYVKGSW